MIPLLSVCNCSRYASTIDIHDENIEKMDDRVIHGEVSDCLIYYGLLHSFAEVTCHCFRCVGPPNDNIMDCTLQASVVSDNNRQFVHITIGLYH
jgi:hypothetical protein